MDFSFDENQRLIANSAEAFLLEVSPMQAVREAMKSQGVDESLWQRITAEAGWHLTHIPEAAGGLGLGFVELCILLEHMGKHLLCAPFFSTVGLGVNALLVAGTSQQQASILKSITESLTTCTLAYASSARCWGTQSVQAEYQLTAEGAVLNGSYSYVIDGHTAQTLIVAARKPNTQADQGIALFIVDAEAAGISRAWTPGMDQTRQLARLGFDNVRVSKDQIMQEEGQAGTMLKQILALASIGLAAEQLGVADQSLKLTIDYISERKQFGRPIGGFQAIKHKAADMLTQAEAARSAVYYAACIADEFFARAPLGQSLEEAASIAKAASCDAAFFNAGSALQMHGGVGFSWEYDIHLYFKRAKAAQVSFGDSAWHKEWLAQMLLNTAA